MEATAQLCHQHIADALVGLSDLKLPAAGGMVLVVGVDYSPQIWQSLWPDAVLTATQFPHLPPAACVYDAVLCLAPSMAELSHIGPTLINLLRPDGVAIWVVPRPWPWGVPGTVWQHGPSLKQLKLLCRTHNLKWMKHHYVGGRAGFATLVVVQPLRGRGGKLQKNTAQKITFQPTPAPQPC